ncbi:MAG TPA: DUF4446 family protein [Nocardioidaceae bacterium]|nr:DUF4446 family protein [Nocardioidaceae bacterium]
MSAEVSGWVALAALAVAVLALMVGLVALRRSKRGRSRRRRLARLRGEQLPADVTGLRGEVAALRTEVNDALRHLAVVRYDAFGDMGGHLSWSVAFLDDNGNGLVLTSIHGRSDSRTYAKNIAGWTCHQQLSPEESEAVELAHADAD